MDTEYETRMGTSMLLFLAALVLLSGVVFCVAFALILLFLA